MIPKDEFQQNQREKQKEFITRFQSRSKIQIDYYLSAAISMDDRSHTTHTMESRIRSMTCSFIVIQSKKPLNLTQKRETKKSLTSKTSNMNHRIHLISGFPNLKLF